MVQRFKAMIRERVGREFPTDPWEQLWGSVMAVFQSWNNDRAKVYRQMNDIPDSWGTAVNVQSMVFGNLGQNSGTGVAFTRDAATGEDIFNGEFLINAQGEDVVAGIRTPQQVTLEGSRRWANWHKSAKPTVQASSRRSKKSCPTSTRTAEDREDSGKSLQGHAGHRVHHPGRQALDAADTFTASAPALRWFASRSKCSSRASSMKKRR